MYEGLILSINRYMYLILALASHFSKKNYAELVHVLVKHYDVYGSLLWTVK